MASAGWEDATTNQKAAVSHIMLGKTGAQGDDDGGGRCRIVSVVK